MYSSDDYKDVKVVIDRFLNDARDTKFEPKQSPGPNININGNVKTSIIGSSFSTLKVKAKRQRTTLASSKQPTAYVEIDTTTDDNEIFYHIDSEQDIWDMWYQFFADCRANNTLHEFSLEKVGILQCGFTVEMRPCLIKELYSLLVVNAATIYNAFETYKEDIIRLFASEDHKRFDINLKHFKGRNEQDRTAVFIAKVFKLMSTVSMNIQKLKWIKKSEANYSEYLVWQFMKQVTNAIESDFICFEMGEYKLKSISLEILRRNDSQLKSCSYKADGCHSVIINDNFIELSLLEFTGKFDLSDLARSTRDHVKGSFSALSLLQQIGHLFKYASLETFSSILVYFIHTLSE
ncbi:hypothetical protein G6F35_007375 [Rhizopus arrhizus]|nr:hypothetical protein G6F24_011698 [Rhizopus arrhizus]KAG1219579.1 hypothetical protein G6F35_007375 [Rhizopus arrhizus]